MSAISFRSIARRHLELARAELASGIDERLSYAALELRKAIEALTYDRAQAYQEDIPDTEYDTWQPRKVMELLLDIDPRADQGGTVAIGEETTPGVPADELVPVGTEYVFSIVEIKRHYDALGSFLHVPTLHQYTSGKLPAMNRLRARCEAVSMLVGAVLASTIFNVTFGNVAEIVCARCDKKIRRRVNRLSPDEPVEVACRECNAPYRIHDKGERRVEWEPVQVRVRCPQPTCGVEFYEWRDVVKPGWGTPCPQCDEVLVIRLSVAPLTPPPCPSTG